MATPRLARMLSRLVPAAYRSEVWSDLLEDYHRDIAAGRSTIRAKLRLSALVIRSALDTRRALRRQLTGPDAARRASRPFEGLGLDLKTAWRQHRSRPGVSVAAIATLALALGVNTALFSVVHGVLLRPLPFGEAERVAFVWNVTNNAHEPLAPARALDLRSRPAAFESGALIGHFSTTVTGRGAAERWAGASVSAAFFDVLDARPLVGDTFHRDTQDRDVVVLSYGLWSTHFGSDPDVVGTTVVMNGRARRIAGVMPRDFFWPVVAPDPAPLPPPAFWLCAPSNDVPEGPVPAADDIRLNRRSGFVRLVVRLAPAMTFEAVQSQLNVVADRLAVEYPETDAGRGAVVVPASQQFFGRVERPLWFLTLATTLVVVIACGNIASLLMVRVSGRARELAVRIAVGASRWRLARLMLIEALLLAGLGGALGMLVAYAGLRAFIALAPPTVGRLQTVGIDSTVVLAGLATTIAVGLLVGVIPAALAWRRPQSDSLRGAGTAAVPQHRLRRWVVAGEVALALTLLSGTTLFAASLLRLRQVDVGFDTANLLTFDVVLTGERAEYQRLQLAFYDALIARIGAVPSVRSVAGAVTLPIGGDDFGSRAIVEGAPLPPPGEERRIGFQIVTPGWFRTLGMPIVAGRDFSAADTRDAPRSVIVNQSLARQSWPGGDAIGRRLKTSRDAAAPWLTVVGVVGDIHHRGPTEPARPEIFVPYSQGSLPFIAMAVRTDGDPLAVVPAVRAAVAELDAAVPLSGTSTMTAHLNRTYGDATFLSALTTLFGGLALLLAMVGVYGLVAHGVGERSRETGLRLALGARPAHVIAIALRDGVVPVVTGGAIGAAAAYGLASTIGALLHDTAPSDLSANGAALLVLLTAAMTAAWLPARRAAQVDPVTTLRGDG